MSTIFIGGSRHIRRLPPEIVIRLGNIVEHGHHVVIGDANGVDKAVQSYFSEKAYKYVSIYCSGETARNNIGGWQTRRIDAGPYRSGFQFYAQKDRAMARDAEFGLMIWDGKSPGTVLNALRLLRAGKFAVLCDLTTSRTMTMKTTSDWDQFLDWASSDLLSDLKARATSEEWSPSGQGGLLTPDAYIQA